MMSITAQPSFAAWCTQYGGLTLRAVLFTVLWVALTLVLVGDMLGSRSAPQDLQAGVPVMVARH